MRPDPGQVIGQGLVRGSPGGTENSSTQVPHAQPNAKESRENLVRTIHGSP